MKNKFYVGVDVGGTKIAAGLVTNSGRIVTWAKTSTIMNAKPAQIAHQIKGVINEVIYEAKINRSQIKGIGMGVPGVVSPDQKSILITPNINLSKFPLVERLKRSFPVPIYLGNDVNLGLLGEKWLGVARRTKNVVGIFPGTGVGGAIIIDNKLVLGVNGAAAELGHMIIDYNSSENSAGVYGSLEALASRRAIERSIRSAIKKGKKSIVRKLTGGNLKVIKSKVLREALKKKDKVVIGVMEDVAQVLGKASISLRHIFNPEMIVFGGGVVEACADFLIPRIREVSQSDPFFKNIDSCQIVQSELGDDAIVLGAVALVKQITSAKSK